MTRPSPLGPDYYEILSLSFPSTSLSKQQLKVAYHKALLKNHPDKASSAIARDLTSPPASTTTLPSYNNPSTTTSSSSPPHKPVTVDQITIAYKTLSDPALRAEYDRSLRLDRTRVAEREKTGTVFHTGLEVVDLEDLACDDGSGADGEAVWYRGCRCGDERGFLVSETDLEREAEHGEVVVGCRGCSLYMKVLFAVQDDDEEEEDLNGNGNGNGNMGNGGGDIGQKG
ncbi:CSL zinc finger-domain-containing protein [Aspergillus pseudoustus]|uniref:Diphthamide biosynthesis protein 4 n=1 Tax=Aspergillus pseudoustus TaxID=1810923 RepID=A0ABR4JNA8_9EURO